MNISPSDTGAKFEEKLTATISSFCDPFSFCHDDLSYYLSAVALY